MAVFHVDTALSFCRRIENNQILGEVMILWVEVTILYF
jgi:hypothetical protein